jgi:predicted TIM-barrel fold metal-dependent hydrolase
MGNGIDSHCHVFDTAQFPYAPDTPYRPPPHEAGTASDLAAVLDAHGLSHALLVNPTSGYRHDNRCMIAAIRASQGRFKGIARVPPEADASTLDALRDGGVIGIRIDLIADGIDVLRQAAIPRLFAQLRERRWQIHVQCEGDQLHEGIAVLRSARAPIVVDHCGRPDPAKGIAQPGFQALIELGRDGHFVKLSGPFRFSREAPPYADAEPFVAALIDTFTPKRCVWGSDWPFLRLDRRMDYGPVLANLERWFPDSHDRRQVLWDTPAQLFGFP